MTETIDAYWSFRSPYSYLVTPDLLKLRDDYDVQVRLRVVLPIAVRSEATLFDPKNRKPITYIIRDSVRRAEFLGLPMSMPQPDPIVQDFSTMSVAKEQPYIYRISTLGVEAERRGKGIDFAASVARMIWGGVKNWDEGNHLANAAGACGLNLADMEAAIDGGDHRAAIDQNHADLDAAGHWGVPTMVVKGEPFFGQDRIDTLRWRLDGLGLRRVKAV